MLLSLARITAWASSLLSRAWAIFDPRRRPSAISAAAGDVCRSRRSLLLENAVLRHQLSILLRSGTRSKLRWFDRPLLLLGARLVDRWRAAIVIVRPETLIRWHRAGFRLFWRTRSRRPGRAPLPAETAELIRDMARRGRLWGAERIRGELLKLGIRVSKRTIQKYIRDARGPRRGGQAWASFLRNHADRTWACDFIQAYDLLFRQVYAFFIVHLASRRVVYAAGTRNPTQAWTAQQLRNATMAADAPAILVRDRDQKFGAEFDRVAEGAGARVIKTAVRAPNMNAIAERFVGSVRREVLDHVLLLGAEHLDALVREYQTYFNEARPHQALGQRRPFGGPDRPDVTKPITRRPVLGSLHVDYRRAA